MQRNFLWGDGTFKRKIHTVNWDEVCKSKANDGLKIGKIRDKNQSMLTKWIWRFGRDENGLWRRVIRSKYKVHDRSLFWKWHINIFDSFFVKSIECLLKTGSQTKKLIKDGFTTIIGNGDRAYLWSDIHVEGKLLKDSFLGCFTFGIKKSWVIQGFGGWNISDSIAWSANSTGLFIIGSYRKALGKAANANGFAPNFFWQVLCPYKVKVFLWQLWKGKLLVTDVLQRQGMNILIDLDCPFCKKDKESVDHCFLHCQWSNSLWLRCMSWLGVNNCCNKSSKGWLDGWLGLYPNSSQEKVESLVLSLRGNCVDHMGNRILLILEEKKVSLEQAEDLVKFCLCGGPTSQEGFKGFSGGFVT
ncbi:hypothetical protein Ddye_011328 [Dipteronia dyeriana]|uniref:Reverse transcriptase zinc-binding domain-containing protein n=1 Tax=Dipteronia dyeriana TaxID=168575 RepID=A0AAD9X2B4_9ROSI|nr:hypothetical protein Ddye_011328 [Dipteronia dyeriana]